MVNPNKSLTQCGFIHGDLFREIAQETIVIPKSNCIFIITNIAFVIFRKKS